jgi:type II secretory pathway predicted ATPase ExeA
MYKNFYHLTAEPFSAHPSTDTFFISSTHKEAWYYLLFGIETQEPFLVLTGEYGMGKTLLCLQFLKIAKEKGMHRIEYIATTNEGYGGILRRIATNMGISPLPENEEILQDMIYDRFKAEKDQSRFYLIIDDAHELDLTTLSKLKYLSTFSYDEFFPVVMVFVAHPSFLKDLKTSALSSLNQRIKRRYHLAQFNLDDTKNYIYYRLLKSGATGIPSFSDETIQKIFEYSGGVPRLINNICDTCLLIGASNHMASIPSTVVEDARKLVEGSLTDTEVKGVKEENSEYESEKMAIISEKLPTRNSTFSENLTPIGATKQEADFTHRMVIDEYEQDIPPTQESASGKKTGKFKNVMIVLLAVVLLIAVVVLLSKIFIKDNDIFSFFSSKKVTTTERPPVKVEKHEVKVPAAILRDELPDTPSGQIQTKSDQTGSMTPARNDAPLKK